MSTKQTSSGLAFRIASIGTDEFSAFGLPEVIQDARMGFTCNLQLMVDVDRRQLGIQLHNHFEVNDEPVIRLIAHVIFEFEETSWTTMLTESKVTIKKALARHLTVITVGTVRGVLHAKTEGTPHSRFILPLVNVEEMVVKDLVVGV